MWLGTKTEDEGNDWPKTEWVNHTVITTKSKMPDLYPEEILLTSTLEISAIDQEITNQISLKIRADKI